MMRIENEITIPAAPGSVWQVLMDFERYKSWHPFIRLKGVAELGGTIRYVYTSSLFRRHTLPAPALITQLEPEKAFAWRTGLKFLLDFTEGYTLSRHPTGTRLIHRIEYHGLVASLSRGGLQKRGLAMMSEADTALRAHLSGRKGKPDAQRRPAARHKGHSGR